MKLQRCSVCRMWKSIQTLNEESQSDRDERPSAPSSTEEVRGAGGKHEVPGKTSVLQLISCKSPSDPALNRPDVASGIAEGHFLFFLDAPLYPKPLQLPRFAGSFQFQRTFNHCSPFIIFQPVFGFQSHKTHLR